MLDWTEHHSTTIDFVISEIELVIVSGLNMYPFYVKLEKLLAKCDDLKKEAAVVDVPLSQMKISGGRLAKIFDDSYEKINSENYDPENDFSQIFDGRGFRANQQLIFTALLIYKQSYLSVAEIANVMDLFKKFTMKQELEDGSIKEATDFIFVS